MFRALLVLIVAIAFLLIGCWADGWDFSLFKIIKGGNPEFSWKSVAAIFSYGVSGTLLGLHPALFRTAALEKHGIDPNAGAKITLFHSENYGCMLALYALLSFLSLPAAIVLCIWHYIAS